MKKSKTKTETVYALRHIKSRRLLSMSISSNAGSDFCGETTVSLHESYTNEFDQDIWYVDDIYNAEYVRQFSTEWFNAGERTPKHDFEPEELEVVEVIREIRTMTKNVKVPTFMEYMELQYAESEPQHFEYIKKETEDNPHSSWQYGLYDLMNLISNKKWPLKGDIKNEGDKSKSKRTRKEF